MTREIWFYENVESEKKNAILFSDPLYDNYFPSLDQFD